MNNSDNYVSILDCFIQFSYMESHLSYSWYKMLSYLDCFFEVFIYQLLNKVTETNMSNNCVRFYFFSVWSDICINPVVSVDITYGMNMKWYKLYVSTGFTIYYFHKTFWQFCKNINLCKNVVLLSVNSFVLSNSQI